MADIKIKKIKMDANVKRELLGILPVQKGATTPFTPDLFSGVPEEFRPVFHLGQLSKETVVKVKEAFFGEITHLQKRVTNPEAKPSAKAMAARTKVFADAVKESLKGWDNLLDYHSEEPTEFTEENAEALPDVIVSAILTELSYICSISPRVPSSLVVKDEKIKELEKFVGDQELKMQELEEDLKNKAAEIERLENISVE